MIKIIRLSRPDDQGREIAIDWGKVPGTYIRLTMGQWLDLLREVDQLREKEGWTLVRRPAGQRLPAAGFTAGASAAALSWR